MAPPSSPRLSSLLLTCLAAVAAAAVSATPAPSRAGSSLDELRLVGECASPQFGPMAASSCLMCAWYSQLLATGNDGRLAQAEPAFDGNLFAECCTDVSVMFSCNGGQQMVQNLYLREISPTPFRPRRLRKTHAAAAAAAAE